MDFISGPVISGFCSAAATTVIFSQIKIILGLKFRGSAFATVILGISTNWNAISLWDTALGVIFIVLLILLKVNIYLNRGYYCKGMLNDKFNLKKKDIIFAFFKLSSKKKAKMVFPNVFNFSKYIHRI